MAETQRRRRAAQAPANRWKPGERELRNREVARQSYASIAQIVIAAVAIIGVFIAGLAALKAGDAVDIAKRGIQSNADENRLSTAIDGIGGADAAQRVAGLTLLRRLATQRLENATEAGATDSDQRDARRLYHATVDILATFLKTTSASPEDLSVESRQPIDFVYAEADLKRWLENKDSYRQLAHGGGRFTTERRALEYPNVDLANAPLFGVAWSKIDFSWLGARNLPGVDFRRADLSNSTWGLSTLRGAHMQCVRAEGSQFRKSHFDRADLSDAHFKSADLRGATFQGANLSRSDFTGAKLGRADFTDADLTGADLTSTDLRGAKLTNAHLVDAELANADLVDADLTGADLTGARVDNSTKGDGVISLRDPSRAPQDYGTKAHPECP